MPVETYVGQLQPEDQDAVIWRFVNMKKFRDLVDTQELYFCRADLFSQDETEGLPPENYKPFPHLNPLDLNDRRQIDDSIGSVAQDREAFYINCWHLFREETCKMWEQYGKDGVAICSRYRLLKTELYAMKDRAFIGLVKYGSAHMEGWNLFRFITHKRKEYAAEQEVRAWLWIIEPHASGSRHFDSDNRVYTRPLTPPPDHVLKGHRRKISLQALVTGIVVTPWASSTTFEEIRTLVENKGYTIPVQPSALTRYREFLPC
ncbi:MAG: hypothetical protein JWO71_1335 [Candidatus Acidoferrum typicum]|nr:hypothetical protein [Candidatus Acidoferrum typicum]